MKFSNKDISDYYRQTQNHYEKWWNLKKNLSIHYGLWFEGTRDFNTALQNTNREMAKNVCIKTNDFVLDAGCGVGGAAIFLAKEFKCKVEGVTLEKGQVELARIQSAKLELSSQVSFSEQSFLNTTFKDNTFDVVWACESTCYAQPKEAFLKEAFRVLKPGGKVIITDYFMTTKGIIDKKKRLKKWANLWAIESLYTWADLSMGIQKSGLELKHRKEYTKEVLPSSKKMYQAGVLGAFFSEFYNLFNNTSKFAKKHYQSGIVQYQALQNKEWEYWMVCLGKPLKKNGI